MIWTYDRADRTHTLTREDGIEVAYIERRADGCWWALRNALAEGRELDTVTAKRAVHAALIAQAEADLKALKGAR